MDVVALGLARSDAARRYQSAAQLRPALPGPVVATRPAFFETLVADTGRSCRLRHVMLRKTSEVRLVYVNYHHNEAEPNGPIKVMAGVEPTSGARFRVIFPGQDVDGFTMIPPGGRIISEPMPVELAEGATFWTNTFVAPAGTGTQYPLGIKYTSGSSLGVGDAVTISATPYVTAANPGIDTTQGIAAYGPTAIIGSPVGATTRPVTVALVGDSILAGYTDSSNNATPDSGFAAKALMAAKIGHLHLAMPGQGAVNFATAANSYRRRSLLSSCTSVLCNYGTNDLSSRTAAQLQTDLATIWRWCKDRGLPVWQTTITPRTNAGNTAAASVNFGPEGGSGSERTKVNTWLRAGAPLDPTALTPVAVGTTGALVAGGSGHPLRAIVDVAAATEQYSAGADTYLWKAGMTSDGIHPTAAGHTAIQALVPTSQFV